MARGNFVAYYRVSTAKQGRSGLGLEAQKAAVTDYLNGGKWNLCAEFTEIESGKHEDRPQLDKALAACRVYGAKLVIAKLDRLSRNAHFLLGLQNAATPFVCCDMPDANELTVGIMAVVAQAERKMISKRTKEALAAAKKRGVKLGGFRGVHFTAKARKAGPAARKAIAKARATDLEPIIAAMKAEGIASLNAMAHALTEKGVPTARGGSSWTPMQVKRVIDRISA